MNAAQKRLINAPPGASICTECDGHTTLLRLGGPRPCVPCSGRGYWTSDQWFTPPDLIERMREAMGHFDLDPFSCAEANGRMKAIKYFDQGDDGYAQDWSGRVVVNWPGDNARGAAKVIEQLPRVESMLVLLYAMDTSTRWYHDLLEQAPTVCHIKGRVRFLRPGGSCPGSPARPQGLLGWNVPEFDLFDEIGSVHDL